MCRSTAEPALWTRLISEIGQTTCSQRFRSWSRKPCRACDADWIPSSSGRIVLLMKLRMLFATWFTGLKSARDDRRAG